MSIGLNIKRLRESRGLTQKELGDIAGVTDKAVSTWETGIKDPRMGAIQKLADYFGVKKSEIIDDDIEVSSRPTQIIQRPASIKKDYTFANTIRRLCEAWDKSPLRVERDLRMFHDHFMRLLHAQEQPTDKEVDAFAQYFSVPRAFLAPAKQETPQLTIEDKNVVPLSVHSGDTIPVLGKVPAGVPIEAIEDIIERVDLPEKLANSGHEYFGLLVTGNSMYPEYHDGDTVIVRVQPTAETGDDVVAYIDGSDATLKRITITEAGIQLRPINPEYETRSFTNKEVEEVPVRIAGIVVEQRRNRRR